MIYALVRNVVLPSYPIISGPVLGVVIWLAWQHAMLAAIVGALFGTIIVGEVGGSIKTVFMGSSPCNIVLIKAV